MTIENLVRNVGTMWNTIGNTKSYILIHYVRQCVCLSFTYLLLLIDSWPLFLWYPLSSSFSQFFLLSVRSFFFSDIISLSLPLWRYFRISLLLYTSLPISFHFSPFTFHAFFPQVRTVSTELIGWRPRFSFHREKKEKNELSKRWTGFRTKTLTASVVM